MAEGNAFLHFSFFVPNPKSLGAHGSKIQRDVKSSVQGTHSTGDRQRERGNLL